MMREIAELDLANLPNLDLIRLHVLVQEEVTRRLNQFLKPLRTPPLDPTPRKKRRGRPPKKK